MGAGMRQALSYEPPNKALVLTAPAARQHTARSFGGRGVVPRRARRDARHLHGHRDVDGGRQRAMRRSGRRAGAGPTSLDLSRRLAEC
jgi:hypothetical protein